MKKEYVEKRGGGYYVAGTRISLDSVVYGYKRGASPESIQGSYPLLTLEEVYGSVAFYLANEELIDKYLAESEIQFEKEAEMRREKYRKESPELYERLKKARLSAALSG